jgi:hypothetical protein
VNPRSSLRASVAALRRSCDALLSPDPRCGHALAAQSPGCAQHQPAAWQSPLPPGAAWPHRSTNLFQNVAVMRAARARRRPSQYAPPAGDTPPVRSQPRFSIPRQRQRRNTPACIPAEHGWTSAAWRGEHAARRTGGTSRALPHNQAVIPSNPRPFSAGLDPPNSLHPRAMRARAGYAGADLTRCQQLQRARPRGLRLHTLAATRSAAYGRLTRVTRGLRNATSAPVALPFPSAARPQRACHHRGFHAQVVPVRPR